jgi:carboxymethylenebutenolidase
MSGKWISIKSHDQKEFGGYLSLPPTGKGPGIVLIQEIFGVNAHIQGVADQYASDGFVVLAPDMFWRIKPRVELGYDADGFKNGMEFAQKMDGNEGVHDIRSTIETLKAMPEVTGKVAAVGYCMGGRYAFLAAANAGADAAVCYYPGGVNANLDLVPKITVPMLFHFGGLDTHIPAEVVKAVKDAFAGHHDATIDVYDDADHGFNCWARPMYHQKSAALARGRSLEFLSDSIS